MALGDLSLTFNDIRKRQNVDGNIDNIIELVQRADPIMDQIKWIQGNLPTGNRTTQRTSLPRGEIRRINRGVGNSKSTTRQITDTCAMIEGHSQIDKKLLKLQNDPMAYRMSEDRAMVMGMTQQVCDMLFYGNADKNPDEFNGIATRLASYGGKIGDSSYQVINGGGTTVKKQTSAYLVCFGDQAVTGIYPKNSAAGFSRTDKGEIMVSDPDGKQYEALLTIYGWEPGLAVHDPRMLAAVRNIDTATLALESAAAEQKKAIVDKMIIAQHRIRHFMNVNAAWYVSPFMMTLLNLYYNDKANVYITRKEAMDGMPEYYVNGIRVLEEQAITDEEAVIKEAK